MGIYLLFVFRTCGVQLLAFSSFYLSSSNYCRIPWKDKVSNESVRAQTQLEKIDLIIKERRLRWLGHVLRMDDNRLPKQVVHWTVSGTKRKPGRPRKNWIDTIQQDLKSIGMTWEVAQQLAVNREGWRRRVAQCVFDTG